MTWIMWPLCDKMEVLANAGNHMTIYELWSQYTVHLNNTTYIKLIHFQKEFKLPGHVDRLPWYQLVENLPAIRDTWVRFPGEGLSSRNPSTSGPRILPGRIVNRVRRGDLSAVGMSTTKVSPNPGSFGYKARSDNKSYRIWYQQLFQNKEVFSKVMVAQ